MSTFATYIQYNTYISNIKTNFKKIKIDAIILIILLFFSLFFSFLPLKIGVCCQFYFQDK
jgi:hypothetical protein